MNPGADTIERAGWTPSAAARADDADWTIREIVQQPDTWRQVVDDVRRRRDDMEAWLAPLLARPDLRIILTGAGTSAYAGRMLAPVLTRVLGRRVEAIATTDIVAAPETQLLRDVPTLLVSFARSGGSPESVAAVTIADQLVADCHHLAVCCDGASALVEVVGRRVRDGRCVLMPPETLDRSFAMTSSVTSMVVAVLELFAPDAAQAVELDRVVRALLDTPAADIDALIGTGLKRVVFLGSGALHGVAMEAALKCLELSAGRTDCYAESPLGLRHGPKFVVNAATIAVILVAADDYTQLYDLDIVTELERDGIAPAVVRPDLSPALTTAALSDARLGVAYLVWCQLLAYRNARAWHVSPDNPSPGGEVNRVVKGVSIHPMTARSG